MYLPCGDGNVVRKVCVGYDHWMMKTTPPSVHLEAKFFLSLIYNNSEDVRCQGISLQNLSLSFKEITSSIRSYDSSLRLLVK